MRAMNRVQRSQMRQAVASGERLNLLRLLDSFVCWLLTLKLVKTSKGTPLCLCFMHLNAASQKVGSPLLVELGLHEGMLDSCRIHKGTAVTSTVSPPVTFTCND